MRIPQRMSAKLFQDLEFEKNSINYCRLSQYNFDVTQETFDIILIKNKAAEVELVKNVNLMGPPADNNF